MWRKLALLAALSFAAWLPAAVAVGLGEIEVGSALNQRFVASIPLLGTRPEELDTLQVRLASNADFERAGIERIEYLSSLRFTVRTDNGAPRIEVRSNQIAREPFVNFLLEIRAGGGRFLREYTVLLDPPSMARPDQPVSTPAAPVIATAPATPVAPPATRPEAPAPRRAETVRGAPVQSAPPAERAPAAAAPVGDSRSYGPVRPQETFWSIAAQLRPDPSITMDQVMLALYEANRQAFDGSIHRLLAGSVLRVPSAGEMTSVSPATAKARLNALRTGRSSEPSRAARAESIPSRDGVARAREPSAPAPASRDPIPAEAAPKAPEAGTSSAAAAAAAATAPAATSPTPPTPAPAGPDATGQAAAPPAVTDGAAATPDSAATPATADGSAALPPAQADAVAPGDAPASVETPVADPAPKSDPLPPPPLPTSEDSGPMELLVPAIGALLVLGGLGYLLSNALRKRREKAAAAGGADAPNLPTVTPSVSAPLLGAAAAAVASKTVGEHPAARTQQELEALSASLDEDADDFETRQFKTQQLPARADLLPEDSGSDFPGGESEDVEAARQALEQGAVDFDLGDQLASETMHINLDEGDPLAEADFHLAYGLYDEAILHLKQAAAKDPERVELRVKLAETYFAAGRPQEFESLARELRGQVDADSWQKIALMGQQLVPHSDLFSGAGGDTAGAGFDLDPIDLGATGSTQDLPPATAPGDDLLDFKLDDLGSPAPASPAATPAAPAGNALEFDLGDFDLGDAPSKPESTVPPAPAGNEIDFDLENFDVGSLDTPKIDTPPAAGGNTLDFEPMDLKLDDFDVPELGESNTLPSGDEAATKLDLARAYVDMGDNDMARNLLNEVVAQGSSAQQDEAKQLLARLV